MSPDIIISPGEGEQEFKPKIVKISVEAITAAAPAIILAPIDLGTGKKTVSSQVERELSDLAVALVDAARES